MARGRRGAGALGGTCAGAGGAGARGRAAAGAVGRASRRWRRGAGRWGSGGCARDERHCCCDTAGPLPRHGWGHGHDTAAMRAPGRASALLGVPAGLAGCLCIWLDFLN